MAATFEVLLHTVTLFILLIEKKMFFFLIVMKVSMHGKPANGHRAQFGPLLFLKMSINLPSLGQTLVLNTKVNGRVSVKERL